MCTHDGGTFTSRRAFALGLALFGATAGFPLGVAAQGGDTIKIGIIGDQSGPYADNGGPGSVLAANMAIRDFGGQVLGKKIVLLVGDDGNKPELGLTMVRKWLDSDGASAIVTGSISPIALGLQELAKERKKPLLIAGSATSDLTGKACSPYGFQFVLDTYALPKAAARALVKGGMDTWFFITVDYTFGHAMERDATRFVTEAGGKVVGSVKHPLSTSDFASYLVRAQASKAKVVALANAGADFANAVKQSKEFGITAGGQVLAATGVTINVVHAIGLDAAAGLQLTAPFYWDLNDETRAWSRRFMADFKGRAPNMIQAGTYSAVMHYLKAVKAAGTDDGTAVARKMRETPVNDFQMKNVPIRLDGQVMRPMYLADVKKKSNSKHAYDYYNIKGIVPAEEVWRPLAEGGCSLAARN